MGRAGSICLLDDQLSAFVEPLQSTRNRERQEQPYQGEDGPLDGSEPRHVAGIFLQVSQAEASSVVQQDSELTKKAAAISTAKRTKVICRISRWNGARGGDQSPQEIIEQFGKNGVGHLAFSGHSATVTPSRKPSLSD
jgi:hypothetical protein